MPMATPSIPTVVPASVNTITAMAPMATTIKAISLWTAAEALCLEIRILSKRIGKSWKIRNGIINKST
jgi:hypothetical protein